VGGRVPPHEHVVQRDHVGAAHQRAGVLERVEAGGRGVHGPVQLRARLRRRAVRGILATTADRRGRRIAAVGRVRSVAALTGGRGRRLPAACGGVRGGGGRRRGVVAAAVVPATRGEGEHARGSEGCPSSLFHAVPC